MYGGSGFVYKEGTTLMEPPQPSPGAATTARKPTQVIDWLLQPKILFRAGLLLVLCLYIRAVGFDFVYDDLMIPVSPWIQSWHGVIDAFKIDVFGTGGQSQTSYYRPLASALTVIVARLTAVSPAWFHLVSILIGLMAYVAAYLFGREFFNDDATAALTAILFAVHPTKVETTAWNGSAFCDGQAAIYFFAVLICYLRWWKCRKPPWILGSALFFLAAIFTKETMIVLPVLIAVHALLVGERGTKLRTAVLLMIPYAVVASGYWFARRAVLRPLANSSIAVQPTFTLVNFWSAPIAFWWYVKELVFPYKLAILYDSMVVRQPSLRAFWLPLVGIVALGIVALWAWRRSRSWRLLFLTAWFVLALGPAIAMSPMVTVHDRYLQLAAYPFCALPAGALLWVERHRIAWRWAAAALSLLLIAAWSLSTWHEVGFWDNSMALWSRAVQVAPRNINARVELARLYATDNVAGALRVLDDGLQWVPTSPGLWRMRGLLLFNAGSYEDARASLRKSLEVSEAFGANPQSMPTDVKYGRATAAFYLGQIEMIEGRPKAADAWLRTAIAIDPTNLDYERAMVENLRKEGLHEEADRQQKFFDQLVQATTMKPPR